MLRATVEPERQTDHRLVFWLSRRLPEAFTHSSVADSAPFRKTLIESQLWWVQGGQADRSRLA
jgi:hypothetical protein